MAETSFQFSLPPAGLTHQQLQITNGFNRATEFFMLKVCPDIISSRTEF